MHGNTTHDFVVVVVCRGMLCLVYCVVCVVVGGCIICVAFPGVLYWVLCLILCAVDCSLACALERVFSFRGFCDKSLRGLTSVFLGCCASLACVVFCVFCCGFSHGILYVVWHVLCLALAFRGIFFFSRWSCVVNFFSWCFSTSWFFRCRWKLFGFCGWLPGVVGCRVPWSMRPGIYCQVCLPV